MSDLPIDEKGGLPEEIVNKLYVPVGDVIRELPILPEGIWHRYSFDVVLLKGGVSVCHMRLVPVEGQAAPGHMPVKLPNRPNGHWCYCPCPECG